MIGRLEDSRLGNRLYISPAILIRILVGVGEADHRDKERS